MSSYKYRTRQASEVRDRLVRYAVEEIDAMLESLGEHRRSREAHIKRIVKSLPGDHDRFVDEFYELVRVTELASELAVVALHRIVELQRGNLLKWAYPEKSNRTWYRFDKTREILQETRGVDISNLDCADAVDELRRLNNAVKHDGCVSTQLAEIARWSGRSGQKLGDLSADYTRLREAVPRYLLTFDLMLFRPRGRSARVQTKPR